MGEIADSFKQRERSFKINFQETNDVIHHSEMTFISLGCNNGHRDFTNYVGDIFQKYCERNY